MSKDYGAAVSVKGYDVKTCADRFLLYSSAFQTLKIHSITKVTGTLPLTVTHNLGHYCPFEIIRHSDYMRVPYGDGTFMVSTQAKTTTNTITIYDGDFPANSDSYTVIVYLNNFATVAEKVVNTATGSGGSSSDYGLRVSKAGYDVTTCTDLQCAFTSKQGFSEIVHKKGINTEHAGQCQVSHNQAFPLKFLAFQKKTTESFITPMCRRGRSTLTLDGAYIDDSYLYMGVDTGGGAFSNSYDFYYIMFKNKLT